MTNCNMQSTQIMRFSAERRKVVLTFRKLSQTSHGLEEVNALLIASVAVKYNIKSIKKPEGKHVDYHIFSSAVLQAKWLSGYPSDFCV